MLSIFSGMVAVAMLMVGQSVRAEENSHWHMNGYGTLGFIHDDSSNNSYVRDLTQRPENQHYIDNSWRRDTRLGLQVAYQADPTFEIVSQIVLRDQVLKRPLNFLDWAHLTWRPMPDVDLRLGRIGFDLFLMSDHRNLTYAYPWVRPPAEYYSWVPLYSIDGGDIAYSLRDKEGRWRLKAQGGRGNLDFAMGLTGVYDFKTNNVITTSLLREQGPWQFRVGYSHLTSTTEASPLAPLHAGLDAIAGAGVPGVSEEAAYMRRNTSFDNVSFHYSTLGAVYDDGTWLVQSELANVSTSADMVTNGHMAYLGLARRISAWTPFVMVSGVRPHVDIYSSTQNWNSIGQGEFQTIAVATLNATRMSQETLSLGLRWDFNSRAALKWQLDTTHIHPNGYGLWYSDPTPAYRSQDEHVTTASFTLDFVF
ncbi:MAG: hypothetical protein H7833_05885 [Magnetococcus sp. DMHC-1]|nr:hypothetical protein [Magnetococcales bacterium]